MPLIYGRRVLAGPLNLLVVLEFKACLSGRSTTMASLFDPSLFMQDPMLQHDACYQVFLVIAGYRVIYDDKQPIHLVAFAAHSKNVYGRVDFFSSCFLVAVRTMNVNPKYGFIHARIEWTGRDA